ncbi:hypothetical protein BT69DRAFT_1283598, partial [Atractiella rhizophila]
MSDSDPFADFSSFGLSSVLSSVDPSLLASTSGLGSLLGKGPGGGLEDVEMEEGVYVDEEGEMDVSSPGSHVQKPPRFPALAPEGDVLSVDGEGEGEGEDGAESRMVVDEKRKKKQEQDVTVYFPDFAPDKILNFTDLFGPRIHLPLFGEEEEEDAEEEEEEEFGFGGLGVDEEFDEAEWERWRERKRRRVVDESRNREFSLYGFDKVIRGTCFKRKSWMR